VKPLLPRDVFPQRIETERLRLRKPESRESTFYARRAAEASVTRAQPLTEEQATEFAAFMIEHWDRDGFGFMIIDVKNFLSRSARGSTSRAMGAGSPRAPAARSKAAASISVSPRCAKRRISAAAKSLSTSCANDNGKRQRWLCDRWTDHVCGGH
jgi:hypothetical protein